jgi:proline racemase
LSVIDSHTAGEPTRMILSGYPRLTGATLAERMAELNEHHDWVRRVAMTEPRGHRDMFGCVLMPPLERAADIAAIFMDAGRYHSMCGHASLGVGGMMVETGRVPTTPPETQVVIETPAGLVNATVATDAEGAVTGVSVIDVASFAVALDRIIEVPGFGTVRVDIGYGGNFFVIARAEDMGFDDVGPAMTDPLIAAGVALRAAANEKIPVCHPDLPHIDRIDIAVLTGGPTAAADARSIVVLGDGQADRSPCGTCTCARMAVLHAKGALAVG